MSLIALIRFVFGAGPAASSRQPHALLSPLLDQDPESGCTDPSRTSSATHDSHCDGERSETDEKAEVLFPLLEHRRCDPRLISDATIGLSDGLTVPFALSAGLSALGNTKVVIFGGMAELIAGAISMGLGVYLGARSEAESYEATLAQTRLLVATAPHQAVVLVRSLFAPYSPSSSALDSLVSTLSRSPHHLIDFLMHFHYHSPPLAQNRAYVSAMTIAAGCFFGGLLPLLPYFFVAVDEVAEAFWWSVAVMGVALFAFGYVKTCLVGGWKGGGNVWKGFRGAVQMVGIGGVAAAAAAGLVRVFS